jgi:hypothetical protein
MRVNQRTRTGEAVNIIFLSFDQVLYRPEQLSVDSTAE